MVLVLAGGFLRMLPLHAIAEGSVISAEICDSADPSVHIETPASDSLTAVSRVALEGTVERTSQIEIFINDAYSSSVAIGQNHRFSTMVDLRVGTNTIRLEAHNNCNQQIHTTAIVVTHQPQVLPAEGSSTNTSTLPPGDTAPETISVPADTNQSSNEGIIDRIKDNLGLGDNRPDSFVVPIRSWLALLVAVLSFAAVLAPRRLYVFLCRRFGWKPRSWKGHVHWVVRLIAAVLAILFVTIVQT